MTRGLAVRSIAMERAWNMVLGAALVAAAGCGEASVASASPAAAASVGPAGTEATAREASPASAPPRFVDPVRDAIETPSAVRWVEASQIEIAGCIDTPSRGGVARPGQDVGELALALGALERVTGREVSPETIATFVARKADEAPLHVHDGCRHVRALREHPEEYGVRRALTDAIVREIDQLGLAHPDRVVHESESLAREAALVEVVVGDTIDSHTPVPLVASTAGDTELWVAHPGLAPQVHEQLARFTVAEAESLGMALDAGALSLALHALAEQDARATLRHLAREVPVYELRFRDVGGDRAPILSGPDASLGCRTY